MTSRSLPELSKALQAFQACDLLCLQVQMTNIAAFIRESCMSMTSLVNMALQNTMQVTFDSILYFGRLSGTRLSCAHAHAVGTCRMKRSEFGQGTYL